MKTLFLNPPSFKDFDGGAGARYQASREVTSFWYPVWLCYPAGMIEGSRVVDAPVQRLSLADCVKIALDYDMVVIYTSTPTLAIDAETARRIKAQKPSIVTVFTGPHVSILPEQTLAATDGVVDIVCRGEFDYAVKELAEGRAWEAVAGISFRHEGVVRHTPDRPAVTDLDALPFVSQIYKRDLPVDDYIIPHIKHPYVSIYTSRGCPAFCTFCLWPQTYSGRKMRTRSPENIYQEVKWIRENLPQVRDIAFEDDTFSADREHARAVARKIAPLGVSWVINARANCDFETLKIMRDAGLHHLIVGYESGDPQILKNIKKGITRPQAEEFTRNCKKLGLTIHGAFVMGLPGETQETIRNTIAYAKQLDLDSIQASLPSPYPGTEFHEQCRREGWLASDAFLDAHGHQRCVVSYPHLSSKDISEAVELFYDKFYLRPKYVARSILKMIVNGDTRRRLLKEGRQYFAYRRRRGGHGQTGTQAG
jgi:hopanoid biosynthesis associated radical SAM protein HpnJ